MYKLSFKLLIKLGIVNLCFRKVYAVERNAERFQVLNDMVKNSGATNIETIHEDVTKLDVKQYADVEYILLDPSCSGSGRLNKILLTFPIDHDLVA